MDEAVMARFEEWFRETSRQIVAVREETVREIAALREETSREFASLHEQTSDRFDQTTREIASLHEETAERFDQTTREIASLREETSDRFGQITQRFERNEETSRQTLTVVEDLRDETARRFDQSGETARHTLVMMEGLRHEIHLIAEAFLGQNEKVERYHSEDQLTLDRLQGWIQPFFEQVNHRVGILEDWAERQQLDAIDGVLKLLGKPPRQKKPAT